jgi:hypothetical protein
VALRRLASLDFAIHAAPTAHDALDVLRRAGAHHGQQSFFGLGRRHAGHRADLGVRDLLLGEGARQAGQGAESAGDADPFSRAAPRSSRTRQLSQCAQERKPLFQPSPLSTYQIPEVHEGRERGCFVLR